ncbi:hypothetical protein JEQ12_012997 [Ovis aries]|nr:hypothetical protein JEQ12_012997 [Ovis aries]
MPARSRHRPSLHSGSPTRAPPPPLEASLSREARRAPDSGSGSDADPEAGPGSAIRNKERVEEEMAGPNQLCIRRWTTKHVAVWLKDEGFFEYVDVLCNKHRLDGITLLTLTEYDLRSPPLEIKVLGDIKRLMLSVRKLQKIHIDVLEEMGYNSDSPMSPMTPFISALQSAEWLCNGEPSHDCDGPITDLSSDQYQYVNGKNKHSIRRLDPEYWKTILSCIYVFIVFGFTSFIMVIVHERVPDMQTYPPLPDIFLDSVPRIPWAFAMTEVCGMILCYIWLLVLLLHKHRSILLRRLCSLMGTVFLLRCFTMFVTSLSVPGQHLQCTGKVYGSVWEKLHRAFAIWSGFGMTLTGVHTCGDYMFSGHTVVLTMLNFFVTECRLNVMIEVRLLALPFEYLPIELKLINITSPHGLAMATYGQNCARPMCIPPSYADLGKAARDIFNKGFGFGLVKLDVKTKSCSGVEFSTSGSSNTDTGKVTGTLETKYKWCEYGLTFTEKWNTDNTLGTEIAIEDQICQGLKLTFDTTFSPNTGKKSGKIKSSYKRECINLGCDVDFDFAGPAIHGSAVFGYEGWLAGYQMTFDSAKSKLTRNNFAVGYRTGDFQLHTNVNDGTEFGGSIYQKVCEDLDTSVNLAWTSGTNCTRFGIAAKYQLDPTASISAKVNNSSLIGVGYTQTLRPGVKLTLSALVDGKSINAGGHKLGLALELEA